MNERAMTLADARPHAYEILCVDNRLMLVDTTAGRILESPQAVAGAFGWQHCLEGLLVEGKGRDLPALGGHPQTLTLMQLEALRDQALQRESDADATVSGWVVLVVLVAVLVMWVVNECWNRWR